jgi:hypothetical protein
MLQHQVPATLLPCVLHSYVSKDAWFTACFDAAFVFLFSPYSGTFGGLMVTSFLNMTLGIQKGSPADAINRSLIQSKEKGARSIRLPKTPWKTTGLAKTLASSPL